ncbi:MAG: hypothetical protein ACK5QB_18140, partial [Pseudanabaena sp.]
FIIKKQHPTTHIFFEFFGCGAAPPPPTTSTQCVSPINQKDKGVVLHLPYLFDYKFTQKYC